MMQNGPIMSAQPAQLCRIKNTEFKMSVQLQATVPCVWVVMADTKAVKYSFWGNITVYKCETVAVLRYCVENLL